MKCNNPKCGFETEYHGIHICPVCGFVSNIPIEKDIKDKSKKEAKNGNT